MFLVVIDSYKWLCVNIHMQDKKYLSVSELSIILDLHRSTIIQSIKDGRIKAIRVGSKKKSVYRILYSELERLTKGIELDDTSIS